jgi:hypothetical protein
MWDLNSKLSEPDSADSRFSGTGSRNLIRNLPLPFTNLHHLRDGNAQVGLNHLQVECRI